MAAAPNVLLVVADSLRARSCSVLGYRRETTPFLDAFAAQSTVYTQARSPSNWTVPSHVSLFTGYEVPEHGFDHTMELNTGTTVFEDLAAEGYATGLFSDNPFLTDHESGLDRPFDHVRGTPETVPPEHETGGDLGEWPNGFWYAERLGEWVDSTDEPWAACVNLMDPHRPYEPLAEYDRWSDDRAREIQESMGYKWHWEFLSGQTSLGFAALLEAIYDGAVRQTDAIFGAIVRSLDDAGVLDGTLVVFAGDHGEGFGEETALASEPPAVSHRIVTHDAMYHVPLVVRWPGQRAGRRVTDLATLSRFPDAVRAVRSGETGDDPAFVVPDGVGVSAQAPIGPAMREAGDRVCGDAAPFAKHARIVYRNEPGDAVRKVATWGEEAYETRRKGLDGTSDDTDVGPEDVRQVFDRFGSVSVGSKLDDVTEFEDASKLAFGDDLDDRLEALGYR